MRILILLAAVFAIWLILWYHRAPAPAPSEQGEPETLPDDSREERERRSLGKTLTDAAEFFRGARAETDASQSALLAAIDTLVARCDGLQQSLDADEGGGRQLRQPLLRLLLPLNGVVRRAARASHRTPSVERDTLLAASADAITRSADQLELITERADEAALRQLEVDLEVLETRLGHAES